MNDWLEENVIKSSVWGMRNNKEELFKKQTPDTIVIHHVGSGKKPNLPIVKTIGSVAATQSVERHHIDVNGWTAGGYHFVITHNAILECRQVDWQGAHVGRHNPNKIGILVYGNFNYEEPTSYQKDMLVKLVNNLKATYPKVKKVVTHGDLASTMCCGKHLKQFVKTMNKSNWQVEEAHDRDLLLQKIQVYEETLKEIKSSIEFLQHKLSSIDTINSLENKK